MLLEVLQKLQVRKLSRKELEEFSLLIASKIEEKIRSFFKLEDTMDIRVEVTEDWPYVIDVDVEVSSRFVDRGTLQDIIEKSLNEAFKEIDSYYYNRATKEIKAGNVRENN